MKVWSWKMIPLFFTLCGKKGKNRKIYLSGLGASACIGMCNGIVIGLPYNDYSYMYFMAAWMIVVYNFAAFLTAWLKGKLDKGTIDD